MKLHQTLVRRRNHPPYIKSLLRELIGSEKKTKGQRRSIIAKYKKCKQCEKVLKMQRSETLAGSDLHKRRLQLLYCGKKENFVLTFKGNLGKRGLIKVVYNRLVSY